MKRIIAFIFFMTGLIVFGADIAKFEIEVKPNPTNVGNANDVIIKAVDENGNIVTDYVGDAYVTIFDKDGNEVTDNLESIPGDGVITFDIEDQGEKIYSKSLIFNDAGEYKIEVADITDENIKGEVVVTVNDKNKISNNITITIQSPTNNSVATKLPINISATTNSPNTIYKIYINGNEISSGLTDENGEIQDVIDTLQSGKYQLQVKLFDANNNVLGESEIVNFEYKSVENIEFLNKVEVLPLETVYSNDEVEIKVYTNVIAEKVVISLKKNSSDNVLLEEAEKLSDNVYGKKFKLSDIGKYKVSIKISYNGQTKEYNDVKTITVMQLPEILNVNINKDLQNNKIVLNWDYKGNINSFKVVYGNDKNNLNQEKIVSTNSIEISNVDITKDYYFKIVPLNEYGQILGKSSDIIVVSLNKNYAPDCKVDNIKLSIVKENNKRYLEWDPIDGVEKYIIYKSDTGNKDSFVKIAELTGTKWEYPFDPNAKKIKYSYFKVVGICKGKEVQIGNIKKVKVGPEKWLLFILVAFIFVYSIYFVYSRYK